MIHEWEEWDFKLACFSFNILLWLFRLEDNSPTKLTAVTTTKNPFEN